ncbi:MAG: glycosyltransferase [Myxococcota bacterium]
MKIVDVTEFWSERGGGVRSYLTAKAASVTALGAEHRIIAPGPRNEESSLAEQRGNGSRLVRFAGPHLPYDPTYHLFSRFAAVRQRVREEAPDVLEIHSPELAALAAMCAKKGTYGIRTLVWHSDFIDTYLASRIQERSSARTANVLTAPLWAWVRGVASRCHATVVASAWQARKLRLHGVPRVHQLPFGVDKRVFRPEARDEEFRQRFLGQRKGALLVSVGRLAGEKRVDVLIEGFRKLRARRDAVLLVVGDGPERHRLEAQARGSADIVFLGFERDRTRLARIVASADALLHAGPFETFGLAIAEALACATPVVVPTLGGAAEVAPEACSERHTAGDADALVAACERLLARDPNELAASARAASALVISEQEHFGALLKLYRELLQGARN